MTTVVLLLYIDILYITYVQNEIQYKFYDSI